MSSYPWLSVFRQAQEETVSSKLHERVMDVESAIFVRMQELTADSQLDPAVKTELEAIRSTLNELLQIKSQRLGWPVTGLEATSGDTAS